MRRSLTILAVVLTSVVLAGCVSSTIKPLPNPPRVKTPPTSSNVPDYSGTSIVPVKGSTTTSTIPIRSGSASIHGRVLSGGAPVGGASVRIERFVEDRSTSIDVIANGDGTYSVDRIAGGRYRVRAFKPPDVAMTAADVFFLGASESRSLDLNLSRFSGGTDLRASISPDPPIIGSGARLIVTMTTRGVDGAGVARSIPLSGISLVLVTTGGRTVNSPNPVVTDGAGRASWTVQCAAIDNQAMVVQAPDGSTYNINVAGCQLPPPTTVAPLVPVPEPVPVP